MYFALLFFLPRVQRFDIKNKQWLPPRATDDVSVGGGGWIVSVNRNMQEHLAKLYFVKNPTNIVHEITYDDKNDGDVKLVDLGVTSTLWGYQLLVPIYYDELLVI